MTEKQTYPYQDRSSYGNSAKFRTGKACIDCDQPAGTLWSPLWCVECNIKRIDRIDAQFTRLARDAGVATPANRGCER